MLRWFVFVIDVNVEKFDEKLIIMYVVIFCDIFELEKMKLLKRFVLLIKIVLKKFSFLSFLVKGVGSRILSFEFSFLEEYLK